MNALPHLPPPSLPPSKGGNITATSAVLNPGCPLCVCAEEVS